MEGKQPICRFYLQNRCSYQNKCRFRHNGIQTFLIRHAQSQFNKAMEIFTGSQSKQFYGSVYTEEAKNFQFSEKLIDSPLTETGRKEAQNIKLPRLNKIQQQVDIIFVSPLTRALDTANEMMKSKSLKCKRVIVIPNLTEVLSKICDISTSIEQKQQKYQRFDFTLFGELEDEYESKIPIVKRWQDKLVSHSHQYADLQETNENRYLPLLKKVFPEPLETSNDCFNRTLLALQEITSISESFKAQRICIVSHNRILKYIMGRFNNGRAQSFENCEVKQTII